jgi:hypothetical protein
MGQDNYDQQQTNGGSDPPARDDDRYVNVQWTHLNISQ